MKLFVYGATAQCVAELVGVDFKTAVYDFHRLRMIIDQATKDDTAFAGEVEVDERYFGACAKGNAVAAQLAKSRSLVCSSVVAGFTPRPYMDSPGFASGIAI